MARDVLWQPLMALSPAHQKLVDTLDDVFASLNHFTARMVATLAQIEVERVHEELGYTSLMEFCMKRYGMTVEQARLRVGVARLIQKYPQLLEPLDKGVVTMTNLSLLRNMVKPTNVDALVELVSKKSKDAAKEALAERYPKPPEESSLNKRRKSAETGLPRRPEIEPTASDEYELVLRMNRAFRDLIEEMRERTRRTNPSGELTALAFMAFQALKEKLDKQQYKATDRPVANPRQSGDPTFITAAVKRAVVARDGARCTFVGAEGLRCEARGNLQFDHIDLRCRGGLGTVDNVRLRCEVHNMHGAKKELGKEFVAKKIANARAERAAKAQAKAKADSTLERVAEDDASLAAHASQTSAAAASSIVEAADPSNVTDAQLLDAHATESSKRRAATVRDAKGSSASSQTVKVSAAKPVTPRAPTSAANADTTNAANARAANASTKKARNLELAANAAESPVHVPTRHRGVAKAARTPKASVQPDSKSPTGAGKRAKRASG